MGSLQDHYPKDVAHCFGCGALNEHGHHFQSEWDGDVTVARFTPEPYHTAFPGFVYGGLIASLIDCHGIGTAAAAAARRDGIDIEARGLPRYVTASLHVDYVAPTPLGPELVAKGRAVEIGERKVVVEVELLVNDVLCARGKVVAVRMPESMRPRS
ncbi:MAG: PaaI family thioesterase [Planctomycetota bacterium]